MLLHRLKGSNSQQLKPLIQPTELLWATKPIKGRAKENPSILALLQYGFTPVSNMCKTK